MSDEEILNELFKKSILIAPKDYQGDKKTVILEETQETSSKVEICNLPDDAIIIDVDRFHTPAKIFQCDKGVCKLADFIIISNQKKCIIYIELKKTRDSQKDIINQLNGAECFFEYCKEVGKRFWENDTFLSHYKKRFVCFCHTNSQKRRTRETISSGHHSTPNNFLRISYYDKIQFNYIAGLST